MVSLQPEVLITIKRRLICQRMGPSAAAPSTPPASAACDPGCGGNTLAAFGTANQTGGNIKAAWENASVPPSVRPSSITHPSGHLCIRLLTRLIMGCSGRHSPLHFSHLVEIVAFSFSEFDDSSLSLFSKAWSPAAQGVNSDSAVLTFNPGSCNVSLIQGEATFSLHQDSQ